MTEKEEKSLSARIVDVAETAWGWGLMALAFGPVATAMCAIEAYRPRWRGWGHGA